MPISTRSLDLLPAPQELKRIARGLAMLDAILCEDWESRYYSFNNAWAKNESMASMRDGSGCGYFIWFGEPGTAIKGTVKDAPTHPSENGDKIYPGIIDSVPACFRKPVLDEPAFSVAEDTCFLIWRESGDDKWKTGNVKAPQITREYCRNFLNGGADYDGSEMILSILEGKPETYRDWAHDYYELEIELSLSDAEHVLSGKPLTPELLERMGCSRDLDELEDDIVEIGYSQN